MRIFNTLKTTLEAAKSPDTEVTKISTIKAWGIIDVIADDFIINGDDPFNIEYARRADLPAWWNAITVDETRTESELSVTIGNTDYSLIVINKRGLYNEVFFRKANDKKRKSEWTFCGDMPLMTAKEAKFFFAQLVTEYNIPVYTIDDLVAIENGERSY